MHYPPFSNTGFQVSDIVHGTHKAGAHKAEVLVPRLREILERRKALGHKIG